MSTKEKSAREKQTDAVLRYLEEHGSITDDEARQMRIRRLPARIFDLRVSGKNIRTEMITGENEYGTYNCARYIWGGT